MQVYVFYFIFKSEGIYDSVIIRILFVTFPIYATRFFQCIYGNKFRRKL